MRRIVISATMEPTFAGVAAMEFAVAGIGRDHEMRRSFAFLPRNRCGFTATIAIFPKKDFSGAFSGYFAAIRVIRGLIRRTDAQTATAI